jgi:hypothetical protein
MPGRRLHLDKSASIGRETWPEFRARRRRWSIEQKQAIVTAAFGLMAPAGNGAAVPAVPAIEIEFAGSARVRISASVSPRDADHF